MTRRLRTVWAVVLVSALAPAAAPAAPLRAPDGLDGRRAAAPERSGSGATARAAAASGTDPMLEDQWAMASDSPLRAPSAWRRSRGSGVVVAVLDSGVELSHPDLAANLWRNPGEVAGNGADDDGNGVVDDVHGYDAIGRDGDPSDGHGHGTHVAGIVAARAGNGRGVAGMAGRARIMAVRVLDDQAAGDTGTVAEGLRYAVANGARIVNLSLSGPAPDPDLEAAVAEAQAAGVLLVAAAGNQGRDLGSDPVFPASLPHDNVLGVAAIDPGFGLSEVSNFGTGADIAAPGESVVSTARGRRYEWRTGTSMAAPHVAGALALVAAARPGLDWRGLRAAVLGSVRRGPLPVETGTLDAAAALRAVLGPEPRRTSTKARSAKARRAAARRKAAAARRKAAAARRRAAARR